MQRRLASRRAPLFAIVLIALGQIASALAQQPADYRLRPGDQLEVSVWKEADLQRTVIIRPDGKFSFPLVGEVLASGKPVEAVRQEIDSKLRKYIPEPVVTVTVTGIEGNKVYVIGQVNKPGAYVMNPQIGVLQAISVAGGTTAFAALNDIKIIRGTQAQQKVIPFKYDDVIKGRNLEQNILLEGGDVVVVP